MSIMENLFGVINIDNKDKSGNLQVEAHSKVKSTKYFPIHIIDGKRMIFKPLSKTKPHVTPLFAYSEVYWSYIINKYFDANTPRCYLAVSRGIEEEQPKYFEQGILVESITSDRDSLISLYDYFNENPESGVDISGYINFCMKNYDYSMVLSSDFIESNRKIGEKLAFQILLSILRQDQNFHYENINFFSNGEVAPPIDFEYSMPFLFPDKLDVYRKYRDKYIQGLSIKYEDEEVDEITSLIRQFASDIFGSMTSTLTKNICAIVRRYPEVVSKFISALEDMIKDLPQIMLSDPDGYIGDMSSDYWEVGQACYKEDDFEKGERLKKEVKLESIDKDATFKRISSDILVYSKWLCLVLKIYLISYYVGIEDLENLTIEQLLGKFSNKKNVTIEDVEPANKKLILKRGKEFVMPDFKG